MNFCSTPVEHELPNPYAPSTNGSVEHLKTEPATIQKEDHYIESLRYNLFNPIHQAEFTHLRSKNSSAALSRSRSPLGFLDTYSISQRPPLPIPSQKQNTLNYLRSIYKAKNNNIGFTVKQPSRLRPFADSARPYTSELQNE